MIIGIAIILITSSKNIKVYRMDSDLFFMNKYLVPWTNIKTDETQFSKTLRIEKNVKSVSGTIIYYNL